MHKWLMAVLLLIPLATSAAAENNPRVFMRTAEGDIEIELFVDKAPVTARHFLSLVDNGDFDGATFYRVVTYENDKGSPPIEVIQGGVGDAGEAFPTIEHETTADSGVLHTDGIISMARGAVGTASTEFFICVGDQPGLDFGAPRNPDLQGFAAFGKVVRGMDIVMKINELSAHGASDSDYTAGQILAHPVAIEKVERVGEP